MIEEYTVQFLDILRPALAAVPPPVYLGVLLGMVNSCVFYLLMGRGFRLFLPYLFLGSAAAGGAALVSGQLPETGPLLGDVSIVAVSILTWTILLIARSMRL